MDKPEHPHLAAVHLMRAIKCCDDCNEVDERELASIR